MIILNDILDWLFKGDPSLQYQTSRDLLNQDDREIQSKIAESGWGKQFLLARNQNGHWGRGFYQPKWTSSHYTLLDLRNLCIAPNIPSIQETIELILHTRKSSDGGVNPGKTIPVSDVCVNGMFLNYASYFGVKEVKLRSIIDFILSQRMADGGYNCRFNRSGAVHSSLHSTLSVAEGLAEYRKRGYAYRRAEVIDSEEDCRSFMLLHRLFLSDRTGKIINREFLRLSYPARWKYDVLRALDYFRYAGADFHVNMIPALEYLSSKRSKDGTWALRTPYPGAQHFQMETPGQPSRWNTLRAYRVFQHWSEAKAILPITAWERK